MCVFVCVCVCVCMCVFVCVCVHDGNIHTAYCGKTKSRTVGTSCARRGVKEGEREETEG